MATSDDVETNLGRPLTPSERSQVDRWIDQASRLIERRARRFGRTVESLDPHAVLDAITEAVTRRVRQPEPVSQVSVQVDDGTVSKTYTRATGLIEISPDSWADLGLEQRGAFTIRPTYRPDCRARY